MRSTDLFEKITLQIADAIEAGAGDFRMPWARWGEALASPINAVTGKPYRGINVLMLWAAAEASGYSSGRWGTYRQWASRGAQVRKGEKSTPVLYWQSNLNSARDEEAEARLRGPRFIAKVYNAFNADQVDGDTSHVEAALDRHDRVEIAEGFFQAIKADIRHGGDRACYVPGLDQIWLPKFEQFRDGLSFYATLAHETVHWSGAKHRLDRNLASRFGSDAYAMEELVAELGSAFIAAHLGLSVEPRPDHAAYVSSWLRVLRSDSRAILTAAATAQEAVDYIVSCTKAELSPSLTTSEDQQLEPFAA